MKAPNPYPGIPQADIGPNSAIPTPVPATFRKAGWSFKRLARSGEAHLYLKTKPGAEGNLIRSWEVVIPRKCKERVFRDGIILPAAEVYPSSEEWGQRGWTYTTEAHAREMLEVRAADYERNRRKKLSP